MMSKYTTVVYALKKVKARAYCTFVRLNSRSTSSDFLKRASWDKELCCDKNRCV